MSLKDEWGLLCSFGDVFGQYPEGSEERASLHQNARKKLLDILKGTIPADPRLSWCHKEIETMKESELPVKAALPESTTDIVKQLDQPTELIQLRLGLPSPRVRGFTRHLMGAVLGIKPTALGRLERGELTKQDVRQGRYEKALADAVAFERNTVLVGEVNALVGTRTMAQGKVWTLVNTFVNNRESDEKAEPEAKEGRSPLVFSSRRKKFGES